MLIMDMETLPLAHMTTTLELALNEYISFGMSYVNLEVYLS